MWSFRTFLLIILVLGAIFLIRKTGRLKEGFLIDIPTVVPVETVDKQTLSSFTVYNDTILDFEALSAYFLQHPDVGAYDIYTVSDVSIQALMTDLVHLQNDHAAMRTKYSGLIMAVVYNPSNNTIMYNTVEKPWLLETGVFEDAKYRTPFASARVYVPYWTYSSQDPGSLSIDPACLDMLTQWKDTDDASVIAKLEVKSCLSKENKIRFVAMILLNYLKILDNNAYGMTQACGQWSGIMSNIDNPELKGMLMDINKVCEKIPIDISDGLSSQCVKPFNDWAMSGSKLPNECTPFKKSFLARIQKFLEIGERIPVEYLESFYLLVDKLYDSSINPNFKDVIKSYTMNLEMDNTKKAGEWKRLLDDLFRHLIKPMSVKYNGRVLLDTGINDAGHVVSNDEDPKSVSVIEYRFDRTYQLNTMILKPVGEAAIKKYSLSYGDAYVPTKYVEFGRVLYGNDDSTPLKVNSLDGIVTASVRIFPLEWDRSLGFRISFEGIPVLLDNCSQKISICEHNDIIDRDRSYNDKLRMQLNMERSEKMRLLEKIHKLKRKTVKAQDKSPSGPLVFAGPTAPKANCLPPIALPPIHLPRPATK